MSQELQAQLIEQQQVLLNVTRQIAGSMGLSEIIPHILDGIQRAIKPDGVRLLVVGTDKQWHVYAAGLLVDGSVDAQVVAWVAEKGDIALTRGESDADLSFLPADVVTLIAVPLVAHDAALCLFFRAPRVLEDVEKTFLSILGGQAAIAITNSRSFTTARKRREWLAAVLTSTPDPVLVVDRDLHLQLANPAAHDLFPTLGQFDIGQPLDQLGQMADLIGLLRAENGTQPETLLEYTAENGRIYAPRISDVRTEDGEMTGWVLVLRDISHFKRLNDNMSEFLSTVSHDMRSPLTFMKGYLDMMGMVGELNDKQRDFIEKTTAGVGQMSDMVEKILEAGKLDPVTGTYQLAREPSDIIEIFNKVISSLTEPAAKKNLTFTHTCAEAVPILNVDRAMLTSAFTNLVENAVKYTPDGRRVDVELKIDGRVLVFRVKDDGLGISAEDQKKLFRRNVRIFRKEWKRLKGSGLGLFIVKNVAQRHGGDAWVESSEGQGSTFFISIPLEGANLVGGQPGASD